MEVCTSRQDVETAAIVMLQAAGVTRYCRHIDRGVSFITLSYAEFIILRREKANMIVVERASGSLRGGRDHHVIIVILIIW